MILALDIGNTQTVVGVFEKDRLRHHWRISTQKEETADQLKVILADLLALEGLSLDNIKAIVVSSVVPHCTAAIEEMARQGLKLEPLVVGPGVKTGISILYDNPHEVGADRVVNAVAAYHLYGGPVIIVDFGTATTFCVVSKKGEYLGGAIVPGIEISAEALFNTAAKLSRVEFEKPTSVIGKNTRASLQSGLIFGTAGLVDSMVERIKADLGEECKVVATGGLADLIAPECKNITKVDLLLTLTGLKLIYDRHYESIG